MVKSGAQGPMSTYSFSRALGLGAQRACSNTVGLDSLLKQGRTGGVDWELWKEAHRRGHFLGFLLAFPVVSPHQHPLIQIVSLPLCPLLPHTVLSRSSSCLSQHVQVLIRGLRKGWSPLILDFIVLCQFMTLVGLWLQASVNEDGLVHSFISECDPAALPESVTLGSDYRETENNTNKYCKFVLY